MSEIEIKKRKINRNFFKILFLTKIYNKFIHIYSLTKLYMRLFVIILLVFSSAFFNNNLEDGFVYLKDIDDSIIVDLKYYSSVKILQVNL